MVVKLLLFLGLFLGAGAIFQIFRNRISGGRTIEPNLQMVEYVDSIDYETLYAWLKQNYQKNKNSIQSGYKFGITPSVVSRRAYKEEFGKEAPLKEGNDILCVFISDEKQKNILYHKYFVYGNMSQSLKDLLPTDKVYIQNLQ